MRMISRSAVIHKPPEEQRSSSAMICPEFVGTFTISVSNRKNHEFGGGLPAQYPNAVIQRKEEGHD